MKRFLISVLVAMLLVGVSVAQGVSIAVGGTLEDTLTTESMDVSLALEAGQAVEISLSSTEFDSYLEMSDASGVVASDDDSGGDRNALLQFVAPEASTYTLRVTSFDGSGGAFSLSVSEVSVSSVAVGETVEGYLTDSAVYFVELEAGATYIIDLESDAFDTTIEISDSSGYLLDSDDDGGSSTNSQLLFTASETGNFVLTVGGYGDIVELPYTLSVDTFSYTALTYGESVSLELESGTTFFTVEGSANDIIDITVAQTGASIADTELTVLDVDGYWLNSSSSYGDAAVSVPYTMLSADGTYVITLNVSEATSVTVTASLSEVASLDAGAQNIKLTTDESNVMLTASLEADQAYRLTITMISEAPEYGNSLSVYVTQDDYSLTDLSVSNMQTVILEFVSDSASPAFLNFSSYSYEDASYEVSLAPVE